MACARQHTNFISVRKSCVCSEHTRILVWNYIFVAGGVLWARYNYISSANQDEVYSKNQKAMFTQIVFYHEQTLWLATVLSRF